MKLMLVANVCGICVNVASSLCGLALQLALNGQCPGSLWLCAAVLNG